MNNEDDFTRVRCHDSASKTVNVGRIFLHGEDGIIQKLAVTASNEFVGVVHRFRLRRRAFARLGGVLVIELGRQCYVPVAEAVPVG